MEYELKPNIAKFISKYSSEERKARGMKKGDVEWRRVPLTLEVENREFFIASSIPSFNWPSEFRYPKPLKYIYDYMATDVVFGQVSFEEGSDLHEEYVKAVAKQTYKFTPDYSKLSPEQQAKFQAKMERKKTLTKMPRINWDLCIRTTDKSDPRELHLYTPQAIKQGFFA